MRRAETEGGERKREDMRGRKIITENARVSECTTDVCGFASVFIDLNSFPSIVFARPEITSAIEPCDQELLGCREACALAAFFVLHRFSIDF